jgi:ATP-dependent DNA ligase
VQFSESFEIEGREVFAHACKLGLEGVVSKVGDSAYVSGRGNSWVKKTCAQRETLTIAGFALDEGKWDGIYLGRRKGKDLIRRQGGPRFRQGVGRGPKEAAEAVDSQDATLCQADRPQGHLGRTEAVGRDRVPLEVDPISDIESAC